MLNYNTRLDRLTLPEYGRNIQRMVNHCMTIEDREERNRCALTIIKSMGNLFPELRAPENEHKLWDHLAIMANFNLDIDYPYEVIQPEDLSSIPNRVNYNQAPMPYRHYGHLTLQFVDVVAAMPPGEQRDEAIVLLANQMKKQMLAVAPDGVEDQRIFRDLAELSKGTIRLDNTKLKLNDFQQAVAPQSGKKKKKKNQANMF